jgi:hypothetical protein
MPAVLTATTFAEQEVIPLPSLDLLREIIGQRAKRESVNRAKIQTDK